MPGMLPVINEECVRQAVRTGLGLNAKINLRSVFDRKNYFYPDLPQGYQISQYKSPIVGEGEVVRRTGRRQDRHRRHRAAASGTGCRQVAARPQPEPVLCRPQPLRRGADGDRLQTRYPRRRAGQGLCDQAALDPALSRHLRRRHGEGQPARRRQRLRAQAGRPARHPLRDQEHELDQLHRRRHRIRGAAPDRDHRGRRQRSIRRRGSTTPARARPARCAPRKRRTTTAISRIPICCRWSSAKPMSPSSKPACRNCRTRRRRASSPTSACRPMTPACWWPNARARTSTRPCWPDSPTRPATASSPPTG